LVGFCAIRFFIKIVLEWEWTKSDDLVFFWTALSLGPIALLGFIFGLVVFRSMNF